MYEQDAEPLLPPQQARGCAVSARSGYPEFGITAKREIRTGAAGLAATFALAAAGAPGAMAEKPTKWGHLGIGQAGHITVNDGRCGDWMSLYNASIDQMHSDIAAGDYGDAFQQLDQAAADRSAAHDAGCGWAWT